VNKYAVLLRGINVGGVTLAMADLRDVAEGLGYAGAVTILATGNLLIKTGESAEVIKQRVCAGLSEHMHIPMRCLVRSQAQIERLASEATSVPEGYHHYIIFCDAPIIDELLTLFSGYATSEGEKLYKTSDDLHWIVKKGDTLKGFGSAVLGSRKYQSVLTSRNLNTVEKIAQGLNAL
jgi:uncharacterized protein (DUF1697 family)